jgi:hypothetical protein
MKIQYFIFTAILFFMVACFQKKSQLSDTEQYMEEVNSLISKRSPYQYVNAFKRFETYTFGLDSNLTINKDYRFTMLLANYDTLTRKLISIGILYFKDKNSTYLHSEEINLDDSQRIIKIDVLDKILPEQRQAYYYFRSDSLLYKNTHNIEIPSLDEYLIKIESIKKNVAKELINKGYIDK